MKPKVYYTAYEKLTGKPHPNRRRVRRKNTPKLLNCLQPVQHDPNMESESRNTTNISRYENNGITNSDEEKVERKYKPNLFKSKGILVRNALRLRKGMSPKKDKIEEEDNIDDLNAWEQLELFQKTLHQEKRNMEEEARQATRPRGKLSRQPKFEDDEIKAQGATKGTNNFKLKKPSTDSNLASTPKKKLKTRKSRSQRRKVLDKPGTWIVTIILASIPRPLPAPGAPLLQAATMLHHLGPPGEPVHSL